MPYRDRVEHKVLFKKYMKWFALHAQLGRSVKNWNVFFVEQFDDLPFNRGFLFNAGLVLSGRTDLASPHIANLRDYDDMFASANVNDTYPFTAAAAAGADAGAGGAGASSKSNAENSCECITVHDIDYMPNLRLDYGSCDTPKSLS